MDLVNFYKCYKCGHEWQDIWSCACDDECPECGARDCTPVNSYSLDAVPILVEACAWAYRLLDTLNGHKNHPNIVRNALNEKGRELWEAHKQAITKASIY